MTRVTISGDGSYHVYVKVSRRSSSLKKSNKPIAIQPPTIPGKQPQRFHRDQKRKAVIEQLLMEL
jgi:hypothetical protein